jgi:hypothetical protein
VNVNFRGRSYNFFSASYWNTGPGTLEGWMSEYEEARNPTVDGGSLSVGAGVASGFVAMHEQRQVYNYGFKTGAQVHRACVQFLTPYPILAQGRLVLNGCTTYGNQPDSVVVYAIPTQPAGATNWQRFEDLEAMILAGAHVATVDVAAWTGTIELPIPQAVMDLAVNGELNLGAMLLSDFTGTNYPYPGVNVVGTRNRYCAGTPSLMVYV